MIFDLFYHQCNCLTGLSLLVTPISGQWRLMMIGEIEVLIIISVINTATEDRATGRRRKMLVTYLCA
jgi:hypothetical protein